MSTVGITLLANAGVLVVSDGMRLLVDGLHSEGDYPFSKLPPTLLETMLRGDGCLRNIPYLVFTHAHPDHYTPALVAEYLRENRVRRLLLPRDESGRSQMLLEQLRQSGQPFWQAGMEAGRSRRFQLQAGLSVTALGMPHMGKQFSGMLCDCLLLSLGTRKLLLMSDCDSMPPEALSPLEGVAIDAALVNPYFFSSGEGRAFLRRNVRDVILYHIPFAGEDSLCLRPLAQRALREAHTEFHGLYALTEPLQTIIV